MHPSKRSLLLAAIGGMMAAAYLHDQGKIDLSFGFPKGGLVEGILMAASGALAGVAVLLAFRLLGASLRRLRK